LMTKPQSLLSVSVRLILCGAAVAVIPSCSRDVVAPPIGVPTGPAAVAKAPTALAVTSASPSFGDQGTTVDVHILGSGFSSGARATWLLNGVADAHVHTNSTTFISSTELVANITIASDAQLDYWDVQVSLSSGKNGVGSECFEVTSAQVIGTGRSWAINDQHQVVGDSPSGAFFYDDGAGMVILGGGTAAAINQQGTIAVGQDGNSIATAWARQLDNTWHTELLPRPTGSVSGLARGLTQAADGSLLVVGIDEIQGRKNSSATNLTRPVAWRRSASGVWSAPQFYAIPTGASTAAAHDVNSLEEVVGPVDNVRGAVWESTSTYTVLDAIPHAINSSGTLIVGGRNNGAAVYWWRDPATHAWHPNGVPLPTLAGAACVSGLARDVNDAGVIVGWSCTPDGNKHPTVWLVDLSSGVPVLNGTPTELPGLGVKQGVYAAASVTGTAPYIVAGTAPSSVTSTVAVRWNLRQ
jgi:hypothetical protein